MGRLKSDAAASPCASVREQAISDEPAADAPSAGRAAIGAALQGRSSCADPILFSLDQPLTNDRYPMTIVSTKLVRTLWPFHAADAFMS